LDSQILNEVNGKIIGSFLDILILILLRECSMNGNEIMHHINGKFNTLVSSGSVYFHLQSMEIKGLIKAEKSKRIRMYTLTEKGEERIKAILNIKDKILGLLVNVFVD